VLPIKNLALSGQLQIIIQGIEFACFWPQFWDLQTLKRQARVVGGCGGTITAHMDSFCCVQGGSILGIKDTCVPKNLEPDTSDPSIPLHPKPSNPSTIPFQKHKSKPKANIVKYRL